jgi:hypothetical protein
MAFFILFWTTHRCAFGQLHQPRIRVGGGGHQMKKAFVLIFFYKKKKIKLSRRRRRHHLIFIGLVNL